MLLALGILSIVLGAVSYAALWWLSIIGLVFGIVATVGGSKRQETPAKVTGIIGIVLCAVSLFVMMIVFAVR